MATTPVIPMLVLLSACAHSASPNLSGTAKDTASMLATSSGQSNVKLGTGEIGKRFLELIKAAESEEITVDRAESAVGVPLLASDGGKYYGFSQALKSGWSYGFLYYPEAHGNRSRIRLVFERRGGESSEAGAACGASFGDYHNALKEMGYADYPKYGELGDLIEWMYRKDDLLVSIIPELAYSASEKRLVPTCVLSIGMVN